MMKNTKNSDFKYPHFRNLFDKRYLPFIILILILLIAFFLRFYGFPYRYVLGDELVREAVVGIEGARELQAPLIGGFSSAGRFTWGPWFYYQMIFATLVFRTFYAPWIYLGLCSFLCVPVLYKIGEELEDKYLGIIFAALGAVSPSLISAASLLTFPNLANIFGLLSMLIFIKLIKKDLSYWWGIVFGMVIGIGINIHYQMAGLLILPFLLLIAKFRKYIYFLTTMIGIFVTFIPLLLFDLTNHWFELRGVLDLYLYGKNAIYVPNNWRIYLRDFWPSVWSNTIGTPIWVSVIIIILFIGTIAYLLWRKQISKPMIFILIAFFVNFIHLRYYWGEKSFAYLIHLHPFIFIFTGFTIYSLYTIALDLNRKYIPKLVIVIWILSFLTILPASMNELKSDGLTLSTYRLMDTLEQRFPGKTFSLYICSKAYKGNDAPFSRSLLFVSELRNKAGKNGVTLGIQGEGTSGKTCSSSSSLTNNELAKTKPIEGTFLVDFSSVRKNTLQKEGWQILSFRSIYDSTVKWWLKEQP